MAELWDTYIWPAVWIVLLIVLIVTPVLLSVAYLTLAERKVIGWMQFRKGPNVVGPFDVRGAPFETETDEHNHEDEAADGRYEVGGIAGEREMGEHCVVGFVRESERVNK